MRWVIDVRRLAAIDLWGLHGRPLRRRLITLEFALGIVLPMVLGSVCLTARAPFTRVVGAWLVGIALNYVPLAFQAFRLSRHGALEAELAGVDTRSELRRYSRRQFVIVIPLALLVMSFLRPSHP
ncbi:hypothetical protein [Oryzihumus sp.]|uniref:hypothetical protein n=1 Tax=Oryzihumus sp. TaxID=1968903 RepID=UPI002ED9391D